MHGYGSHTFKLINTESEAVYCKFHMRTAQGIKNLEVQRAAELSASDPDYAVRDLFNAIGRGDFPSWNMFIQVMTFDQAERLQFNPFDVTKVRNQLIFSAKLTEIFFRLGFNAIFLCFLLESLFSIEIPKIILPRLNRLHSLRVI